MIQIFQKVKKLQENWGDRADSLDCKAEIRAYDTGSRWECYIYAIDPENRDTAKVLLNNGEPILTEVNLDELEKTVEAETGRVPKMDMNFVPTPLKKLLKDLKKHEWKRD